MLGGNYAFKNCAPGDEHDNTVAAETETSIDESAVSSDWTKFATEDSE